MRRGRAFQGFFGGLNKCLSVGMPLFRAFAKLLRRAYPSKAAAGLCDTRPAGAELMKIADFRRIALSLEGAEEGSHMGSADFRVGGRIFATLAAQSLGYGNLMLTPEQQAEFVAERPDIFIPIAGGWGRMGATHIQLSEADEDLLTGALRTAWKLRREKNEQTKSRSSGKKSPAKKVSAKKASAKRTRLS